MRIQKQNTQKLQLFGEIDIKYLQTLSKCVGGGAWVQRSSGVIKMGEEACAL